MIIDTARRVIAKTSFLLGRSLKKKNEIPSAIRSSTWPKARTGATALAEKA